jgi:hypothetical protein
MIGDVRRLIPLVVALAVTLAVASSAAALDVPIGALRALAQTYEPGVFLPTVLPRSVTKVDIGGATGIGNGPAPSHFLEYHAPTKGAFQLGIWRGDRFAAVVKGLLFHDGTRGSTRAFTAGRFKGTRETQSAFTAGKPNVVSYVWKGGGFTYMLVFFAKPGTTAPIFPGLKPLATIASFKR